MHLLSRHNRSEFLACPQLIRFDYARGQDGFEPTLLIKGSTLLLKYIALSVPMQLAFAMIDSRLLYALKVHDDGDHGGIIWSVAERAEEINAVRGLARGEPLVGFLFNELAVNVAWNNLPKFGPLDRLAAYADRAALEVVDELAIKSLGKPLLESLHNCTESNDEWLILNIEGKSDWKPLYNHFITARASSSLIDLFDTNEGHQQEQIGIWLTDNLQPTGAYHSPQIPRGKGTRELTDLLLSHEFGATLIESKTLSVLARERLSDRAKLKRDVTSHVDKAFGQLRGAIRALKSGVPVTSPTGDVLSVEREKPAHALVLIPDLDLIETRDVYGPKFIREFVAATGGFPHLLDISELLRVVQAAEMIVTKSNTLTPMMAFDYYLMQRIEKAVEAGTLCIEILLRLSDETAS